MRYSRMPSLQADAEALAFYDYLRTSVLPVRASTYDICGTCNLSCEGCLYFTGSTHDQHPEQHDPAAVDAFFRQEAARGINFAILAGAEPSLAERKLAIVARHIGHGTIFSNGTRAITREVPYRIQVSLWGLAEQSERLRGANIVARQMRNYRNDPRAIFVFTISRQNVRTIPDVVKFCAGEGVRMTFNHFSPTTDYIARLAHAQDSRDAYFRFSDDSDNMLLQADDLRRAQALVGEAIDRYPDTVVYSHYFNERIHRPEGIYEVDAATRIAHDCADQFHGGHRHVYADLTYAAGTKCTLQDTVCESCRCYAQALGTLLRRQTRSALRDDGFRQWIELWRQWHSVFWYSPATEAARPQEAAAVTA